VVCAEIAGEFLALSEARALIERLGQRWREIEAYRVEG